MKFKTSAIALAVAGTLVAPMAVQAEGSVYASARIGLTYQTTDDSKTKFEPGNSGLGNISLDNDSDKDTAEIKSISSRFGANG
jgi:hypothetical protein